MNYPNNHKHKFFQKDHEKMMCSECEFELDGEYYVGYVLPLEAQVAELEAKLRQDVSTREQHWSIQAELYRLKAEQAEKEIDALVKERDLYNKNYLELQKQNTTLHEMLNDSARLTDKMADGWCLVSPEDFERLRDKGGK